MNDSKKNQADITEGEVIPEKTLPLKERAEGFTKDFKAICEKWNCQLVVEPVLVQTNHGTWEFAQRQSVGELPKSQ